MNYIVTFTDGRQHAVKADSADNARRQFGPITARSIASIQGEPPQQNSMALFFGPTWKEETSRTG